MNLMQQTNLLIKKKKKKKKIKDIIDPNPGLFIDDQLKPNEQSFQNTTEKVFNLPPQIQQQLDDTVFKKIIKQPIIQPTSWEIIPNIVPKTEDIFIDDDELDLFKKPESTTTINIGRPKDEEYDDLVMISNDDEVKISKSLIETDTEIKGKDSFKWKKNRKPHKKPITKRELQDALNLAVSDLQTVYYNNDTSLDDLETVDYNNDTSITDLVPIKKLDTIDEENDEENGLQVIKTVNSINISDHEDEVKFIKKLLCTLGTDFNVLSKTNWLEIKLIKKVILKYYLKKNWYRKNKNQNKDIEYIKKDPLHPRERLKRQKKIKQEPEVQYIKTPLQYPWYRLGRRFKSRPANIICNKELLKEFPYFNRKIKVNETDKIKRREVIIYKIVKQIPSDNDKYYVKYNKDSDTYYIGKDEKLLL